MATVTSAQPLLQLPDPCLVAVLRCCADDPSSLCSAARAHSRLHQAAVLALTSIKLQLDDPDSDDPNSADPSHQQRLDNLVDLYLASHGQHIDSISLQGRPLFLSLLPPNLTKLSSLAVKLLHMQLQPSNRYQGVLGALAAPPLQQLRLHNCTLDVGDEGLAAALAKMPGLEHLAIRYCRENGEEDFLHVPLGAFVPGLSKLTYLQLAPARDDHASGPTAVLQHLTALTRLVDLQLLLASDCSITAGTLSGAQHLTRLELARLAFPGGTEVSLEPAALAGRTVLQHLELSQPPGGAAGTAQLLCELLQLQQLTCLTLNSLQCADACPPAAAYSALTASSKLQCLDLTQCTLPADVWQHVFPAGRQLPHLQSLVLDGVRHAAGAAAAPETALLVSCCPGLEVLDLRGLQYSRGLLASLQGLSSLTKLFLRPNGDSAEGLEGVCQLTRLRQLQMQEPFGAEEGLLLQLTQLRRLTDLLYMIFPAGAEWPLCLGFRKSTDDDDPVWQQVLLYCLDHNNPELAQQAAAALQAGGMVV